jgi:hypothetical protein
MALTWDDVARLTCLEFEAQVRYGGDDAWRTVGVMREWTAADAIALTAPPTAAAGSRQTTAWWWSTDRPAATLS